MEYQQNKDFQAIQAIITSLEGQLQDVERFKMQDFFEMKQTIEEHFQKCTNELIARQNILINQLNDIYQKQVTRLSKMKEDLRVCIEGYKDMQAVGIKAFQNRPKSASQIWRGALALELPTDCIPDQCQFNVEIDLPNSLLESIRIHGTARNSLPDSKVISLNTTANIPMNYYSNFIDYEKNVVPEATAKLESYTNLSSFPSGSSFSSSTVYHSTTPRITEIDGLKAELAEMKKFLTSLKQKKEKLEMIEKINDNRETEYQKLARAIGYEPSATISIFSELTNFSNQRHHDYVKLIYHQITYWNIIEFDNLTVMQAVVNCYSNLIMKFAHNFDVLTHLFSGASLLLHMLYKNRGANLEDTITVEPLNVQQAVQDEKQKARSGSFRFNSPTLHNITPAGSLDRNSAYGVEPRDGNYPARAPTPDVSNMFQSPLGHSGSHTPSPSKLQFRPIRSSGDFSTQLKAIVGKCFGLLLTFVASRLDPLLDQAILSENFNTKKHSELPSLRPIISFLHNTLSVFQVNLVHLSLSQHFFSEVFARINNILINGVLLQQQFCTKLFGSYLKSQIESLQAITDEMGQMWVGDVSARLQGIKQVAAVLTKPNKNSLIENKIRIATCHSLNSLQLRQLLSMFVPDEFGKRVPIPIINAIGARAPHADTDRILLDVNEVKPFPIKILHYFEVADMLETKATPAVRSLVENIVSSKLSLN